MSTGMAEDVTAQERGEGGWGASCSIRVCCSCVSCRSRKHEELIFYDSSLEK